MTVYNMLSDKERNTVGERLKDARKAKGMTLEQVCEALALCGMDTNSSSLSRWEKGDAIPNAYQLVAICNVLDLCPEINLFSDTYSGGLNREGLEKMGKYRADLVASGNYVTDSVVPSAPEGLSLKKTSRRSAARTDEKTASEKKSGARMEYLYMPVSMLPASAGTGIYLDENSFENLLFPRGEVPVGADFGVRVSGDSMEPFYRDGQIVWVSRTENVALGEEGVFVYDGSAYLKILGEITAVTPWKKGEAPKERKLPALFSYNKKYKPIPLGPFADFRVVGKVLGVSDLGEKA